MCPAAGSTSIARRELRGAVDEVGDRPRAELGEVVELLVERGHELPCTPSIGIALVERVARDAAMP